MNRTARIILATGVALTVLLPLFEGVASAAPTSAATTDTRTTAETTVTVADTVEMSFRARRPSPAAATSAPAPRGRRAGIRSED